MPANFPVRKRTLDEDGYGAGSVGIKGSRATNAVSGTAAATGSAIMSRIVQGRRNATRRRIPERQEHIEKGQADHGDTTGPAASWSMAWAQGSGRDPPRVVAGQAGLAPACPGMAT